MNVCELIHIYSRKYLKYTCLKARECGYPGGAVLHHVLRDPGQLRAEVRQLRMAHWLGSTTDQLRSLSSLLFEITLIYWWNV